MFPASIRRAVPDDLPFILRGWIESQGHCRPWLLVDRSWYCAAQHALCERLMRRSLVLVACNPDDVGQVYGVCVAEPAKRTLHWIYVKEAFRQLGIGGRLMLAAFVQLTDEVGYTVRTSAIPHYERRWNLRFDPHRLTEER
jgi:GNAT superfamily N-acetyltransferase